MARNEISSQAEEYLEALYTLTQDGKKAGTTEISRRLGIAPASVTEMLKKLDEGGYVEYSPYHGVSLTKQGSEVAEKMARKHRLLERFLHDKLKIDKDKVHREACEMEHAISDETAQSLCLTLNAPCRCPDDDMLIPACDLDFKSCDECRTCGPGNLEKVNKRQANVLSLSCFREKQEGKIAFIRGDNKVLRRLLDLGLIPGTKIRVNRVAPLKGPVEIMVRGSRLALGDEIACNVFLENNAVPVGS
jgi:DtxR family transcriptional regulator, Mn-dependent transcriptional regulator